MINELFLYDREEGLFKEILNKSSVIEGRYHVSASKGNDLNTNNLETYINDPKNGLVDAMNKYPLAVCMTPRSRFVKFENGSKWEEFVFNMFFVTPTNRTGGNQLKSMNTDTKTSGHHIWYDWQDMKNVAANFLEVLQQLLSKKTLVINSKEVFLRTLVNLDKDKAVINRFASFLNDQLSGVSVAFVMYVDASLCTFNDYDGVDILTDITLPGLDIHPMHKL